MFKQSEPTLQIASVWRHTTASDGGGELGSQDAPILDEYVTSETLKAGDIGPSMLPLEV